MTDTEILIKVLTRLKELEARVKALESRRRPIGANHAKAALALCDGDRACAAKLLGVTEEKLAEMTEADHGGD